MVNLLPRGLVLTGIGCLIALAGCASGGGGDVSLPSPGSVDPKTGNAIPGGPSYTTAEALVRGVHCQGSRCGKLTIRTVSFAGYPAMTQFVDMALSSMAVLDSEHVPPYRGLAQLSAFFKTHAKPFDEIALRADVLRHEPSLVVLGLNSYIFQGGAHGVSAVQYINWFPVHNHVASLETMLMPDAMPRFIDVLREQHTAWVAQNKEAIGPDLKAFERAWPFKPTDNAALMPNGLQVTYDRYVIAPGSFGEPSITVPYSALKGILRPNYLEAATQLR
jgi:hypothetical protein